MNYGKTLPKAFGTMGLKSTFGVSMRANAGLFGIGGKTMSGKKK